MNNGLSIVGARTNSGMREINDFYPTPGFAVEELLKREEFYGSVFEPACGRGDITEVLKLNGLTVYSADLINRGYGDTGKDFLKYGGANFGNIITNPPFKFGLEFILKAKQVANHKIAMFLKTVFLESQARYDMFNDKVFPLKTLYQFSKRISLYKNGIKMKNGGMASYAWYVWDKSYSGKPTIEWIQ